MSNENEEISEIEYTITRQYDKQNEKLDLCKCRLNQIDVKNFGWM